jgi:hypothetical protein
MGWATSLRTNYYFAKNHFQAKKPKSKEGLH